VFFNLLPQHYYLNFEKHIQTLVVKTRQIVKPNTMANRKKTAVKKAAPKKAAAKPAPAKVLPKRSAAKPVSKKATSLPQATIAPRLVTVAEAPTTGITLNVTFINGLGSLTAKLFAGAAETDKKTIKKSGDIVFADAQTGNSISLNGNAAGTAVVEINRTTDPASPRNYAGPINEILDIL
jgi:hypothetical protein